MWGAVTDFQEVDRVHHSMLLRCVQWKSLWIHKIDPLTAMPANAPAAILAASEKFSGKLS